ncbi:MAG: hypothetical protein ACI4DS_01725 [Eubacterium sp.]
MTEFDVMAKDYIKLGFLDETINQKSITFNVYLESEGAEKSFLDIRTDRNVYRFNNFNVSEDVTQNTITFRPIVIGCYSYFKINSMMPITLEIIKNGTTTVAQQFVLAPGENKIEFDPQGIQKYIMKIEEGTNTGVQDANSIPSTDIVEEKTGSSSINPFDSPFGGGDSFGTFGLGSHSLSDNEQDLNSNSLFGDDFSSQGSAFSNIQKNNDADFNGFANSQSVVSEQPFVNEEDVKRKEQLQQSNARLEADISSIQNEINQLEKKNEQLVNNKKNLISHLEKLQAEYDKDYSSYEADIEEIKSKYTIDDEILKMYADKEVTPIEELIARSEKDIKEIEEQVRLFIEAQQRKTASIESELKIGKKND